jgi:serine/threonine protein kinase
MTGNIGTILYMAPEILTSSVVQEQSTKIDVYSFGIIMYEAFFEEYPYHMNVEQFESIIALGTSIVGGLRPRIPVELLDNITQQEKQYLRLMERCWHGDPDNRPTFDEIFSNFME